MFEERFRGPHRSVSARSAASPPGLRAQQSRRTALRRSPAWAAGRSASCLWKEPVCLLVTGKAIKQKQTPSVPSPPFPPPPGVALSHKPSDTARKEPLHSPMRLFRQPRNHLQALVPTLLKLRFKNLSGFVIRMYMKKILYFSVLAFRPF